MFKILVAEDQVNTQKLIKSILTQEGYSVLVAANGAEAFDILEETSVDLIVLDIMMPIMDGFEFISSLRAVDEETPILILTAKQLPEDKRQGFEMGCDDYLVKPFDHDEFLLRVKALLRRSNKLSVMQIEINDLVIDYASKSLIRGQNVETLPQKEFQLLYKLVSSPNKIFTRLEIVQDIWGNEEVSDYTLNVHINRLRKKLDDYPEIELFTIRGLGYKAVINSET